MMDGFDNAVKFVLRNLQKETLELTMQQKEALRSILNGKDTILWFAFPLGTVNQQKKPQSVYPSSSTCSYFCLNALQQQMRKCLYFSISSNIFRPVLIT